MTLVPTVLILALVVYRNSRPQTMTAGRFWIFPGIVVVLTIWLMWVTLAAPVPGVAVAGAIASAIGLVLGIPLGIARGHHSKVRLGDRPGTFVIDPSMVVMAIWLGAFVARYAVRMYLPNAGPMALGATDGLLIFAIASVITSRVVIFRKYQELISRSG
jgi:hypothetical protein